MARLSLSMLRPIQVTLDAQAVTAFESNRVRALLACLALEPERPHHRGELAALLWSEWPDREARSNLRYALSNLRTAIKDREAAPPYLSITRETLQFNAASDHWLDVRAFIEAIEASQGHGHRDLSECATCAQRLREAVDLYKGELLTGLSLDSAPFEEWLVVRREALHHQALDALYHLGAYYEGCGDHKRVIQTAQRQVALEPWSERAHRQWMRALALNGQRGAAVAQYEACRRVLQEDLGVEPGPETTRLYERIRDGEIEGRADRTQRAEIGPLQPRSRTNLPVPLTPFVGREQLLSEVRERLLDPACRLLTLVGPGGAGKTRLALEATSRLVRAGDGDGQIGAGPPDRRLADGVYFVSLAPLRSVDAIVPTIAEAVGLPLQGPAGSGMRGALEQLIGYLERKNVLLVLDNAEHLLHPQSQAQAPDIASVTTGILRGAPEVTALVTARVALHVQGEHLYPVGGMDVPPSTSDPLARPPTRAGEPGSSSAVRLFVSTARRVEPDFAPTAEELDQVAYICRLVEGMPLGIVLAAPWVRMLPLGEIAAEIERSYDFLQAQQVDLPERQRSLRAAFEHSWNLLPEEQRSVLTGLSVFRAGFTREAACQVAGAPLQALMALVDGSFLHRTSEGRFEMHDLVRQYAAEKLSLSGDEETKVRDRHSAYYVTMLEGWANALRGSWWSTVGAEIGPEVEDAHAAWEWMVARRQLQQMAQAMEGVWVSYRHNARLQEGKAAFQAAAEALAAEEGRSAVSAEGRRVWIQTLAYQGYFEWRLGHIEVAVGLLDQSEALLEDPRLSGQDSRKGRAFVMFLRGEIEYWSRDREHAQTPYEESLALYRILGQREAEARVLTLMGDAALTRGALGEGEQLLREALVIYRDLGRPADTVFALTQLGHLLLSSGRLDEAEGLTREAVAISEKTDDRPMLVAALSTLSTVLCGGGRYAESRPVAEMCLALANQLGVAVFQCSGNHATAVTDLYLGQYASARERALTLLKLGTEIGQQWSVGEALYWLGSVDGAEGDYAEARKRLQQSIAIFGRMHHRFKDVVLVHLALVERAEGCRQEAVQALREALRSLVASPDRDHLLVALPATALLIRDAGDVERAVELYARAACEPRVANSPWFEDVAGREIAAAAAILPPEVAAAAQARGRARDLLATAEELLAELDRLES